MAAVVVRFADGMVDLRGGRQRKEMRLAWVFHNLPLQKKDAFREIRGSPSVDAELRCTYSKPLGLMVAD